MIDVWAVVANGLWVVGLAVALAAWSWASWAANVEGARTRQVPGRPRLQRWVDVGLARPHREGEGGTDDVP